MSRSYSTYSKKSNPWNKRRVDRNLTYDELAAKVNIPAGSLSGLFCGFRRATEYELDQLCKFFNVDRDTGYLEFENIYNSRRNNFPEEYTLYSAKSLKVDKNPKEEAKVSDNEQPEAAAPKTFRFSKIDYLKYLYGKVSCEDFGIIFNASITYSNLEQLIRFLYNKVDYNSFVYLFYGIQELVAAAK